MKLKIFIVVSLLSFFTLTETPKAFFSSHINLSHSIVYKEGIYDITNLPQVTATARLISRDNIASLLIFDPNDNVIFYKKFDTLYKAVNLGLILDDYRIVIVGKGEIAITTNR